MPIITFDLANTCSDEIVQGAKYTGKTIKGYGGEFEVDSYEKCRDECKKKNECLGWVWYSPSSKGNRENECWLKKEMKEKESRGGAVSGNCTTGTLKHELN